jgi:hypothetical protein
MRMSFFFPSPVGFHPLAVLVFTVVVFGLF